MGKRGPKANPKVARSMMVSFRLRKDESAAVERKIKVAPQSMRGLSIAKVARLRLLAWAATE